MLTDEEVVTGGELTVRSDVPLEGWSSRPISETNRHGEEIAFAVTLGVDGGAMVDSFTTPKTPRLAVLANRHGSVSANSASALHLS